MHDVIMCILHTRPGPWGQPSAIHEMATRLCLCALVWCLVSGVPNSIPSTYYTITTIAANYSLYYAYTRT